MYDKNRRNTLLPEACLSVHIPLTHSTQKSHLQTDPWIGPGGKTEYMRRSSMLSLHHRSASLMYDWKSAYNHWQF